MIYFLQDETTHEIKVGFTDNLRQRMMTLQGSVPRLRRLLGTIPGDLRIEKLLHEELQKTFRHICNEWYDETPELLEFIDVLIGRSPGPMTDLDPTGWLWPGWIPWGSLTVITGASGSGKGLVACDLAARVSRGGSFPGRRGQASRPVARNVVFITDELPGEVMVPRLMAAGAEMSNICNCKSNNWLSIDKPVSSKLGKIARQARGPSLVIVDYLRGMDDPGLPHALARWAGDQSSPVACVLVVQAEFNNGNSHGIRDIAAASRCCHVVGEDGRGKHYLSMVKNSVCNLARSLHFSIVSKEIAKGIDVGVVEWS